MFLLVTKWNKFTNETFAPHDETVVEIGSKLLTELYIRK